MISTVRPTTKSDTYRRLFRALAIPYASEIEEATKVTQVPVVCFSYSEEISPSVGRDSEWPEVQEHLVRSLEDERYVDVKDVLALVPPGAEDRKVAVPFRESYDVAVSALPGYEQDLDRLVVRPGDVAEVLALVDVVDYVRAGKNVNVDEIRAEAKKIYNRMVAGKDGNISFSMFEAKGESIAVRYSTFDFNDMTVMLTGIIATSPRCNVRSCRAGIQTF